MIDDRLMALENVIWSIKLGPFTGGHRFVLTIRNDEIVSKVGRDIDSIKNADEEMRRSFLAFICSWAYHQSKIRLFDKRPIYCLNLFERLDVIEDRLILAGVCSLLGSDDKLPT